MYASKIPYLLNNKGGRRVGLGPKEIDGLLVSSGEVFTLLTDHLITGQPLRSESAQEK